ncbi:hypothetical protein CYLTODRAFT_421981 [Cylindrobasidium torrendii FP15055 ss-10]|uniref:Uncharacterized protein n=1 Tax=Cylindrobasidium torrendii FP15055 ss-10 TaxID=1314674 RepID=A0A0D7BBW8_9AGAR|nr:hypothetical protein CYLTODRAFT_421981 [Cylindrobasidium torrendii FP15055 ss-10]
MTESGLIRPGSFVACGLPGLTLLLAHVTSDTAWENSPISNVFISNIAGDSDAQSVGRVYAEVSDEEALETMSSEEPGCLSGSHAEDCDTEEAKELEKENTRHAHRLELENQRHLTTVDNIRRYWDDMRQERILKDILDIARLTRNLEILSFHWYTPEYIGRREPASGYPEDLVLSQAFERYPKLQRLTMRINRRFTWTPLTFPTFPSVTHLHLINPAVYMPTHPEQRSTVESLAGALPALTHLRLTGIACQLDIPVPPRTVWQSIVGRPDRIASLPSALYSSHRNLTVLLQPKPPYAAVNVGFCGTGAVEYESIYEHLEKVEARWPNIHLLWPHQSDWDSKLKTWPLSRALGEGGWKLTDAKVWIDEWSTHGRQEEEHKFWWK